MGSKHDPERILFFVFAIAVSDQDRAGMGGKGGRCSVWMMLSHLLKRSGHSSVSNFNTGTIDINVGGPTS